MGTFVKYRPYYACNALRFNGTNYNSSESMGSYQYYRQNSATRVPNFKDISGTEYGWLLNLNSYSNYEQYNSNNNYTGTVSGIENQTINKRVALSNNYQIFKDLVPFATADLFSGYSINDYAINSIGETYYTIANFVAEDTNKVLYSLSIFNNDVDAYIPNESNIWAENTYYEEIGSEYILLDSEPADWNENYANYYTFHSAQDLHVGCIKFRKLGMVESRADRSWTNANVNEGTGNNQLPVYVLLCAYFLDQPVSIAPGDSYLLSLSFETSPF